MKADDMLDLVRLNKDNWDDFLKRITAHTSPRETQLLRNIFNDLKEELEAAEEKAAKKGASTSEDSESANGADQSDESSEPKSQALTKSVSKRVQDDPGVSPKPAPGHGRRGVKEFRDSETILVPPSFPGCSGIPFTEYEPQYRVVIKGTVSFRSVVYVLPRRRLVTGELQTTPLPNDVGPLYGKCDAEAATNLIMQHYKMGATLYGIEKLQEAVGLPFPQSTQWDVIEAACNVAHPVFKCFIEEVANAKLIHIDSTGKTILETQKIIKERQSAAVAIGKKPESVRHGMRSTVALATSESGHRLVLVSTGEKHAGEKLDEILGQRTNPSKVLLEVDGSAENTDHSHRDKTLVCFCNAHAFRKFKEHLTNYPDLEHVIGLYQSVFKNEARCLAEKLPAEDRLTVHESLSFPLMKEIERWLKEYLFERKMVTPNSSLGVDIRYFLKRFEGLTQFCRVEGAPLHNNENEQKIKVTVKHRKNSLFFKTVFGAYVGDIWMSLIETAILNQTNPWKWIVDLLRHPEEVRNSPKQWVPWAQGLVEMTS